MVTTLLMVSIFIMCIIEESLRFSSETIIILYISYSIEKSFLKMVEPYFTFKRSGSIFFCVKKMTCFRNGKLDWKLRSVGIWYPFGWLVVMGQIMKKLEDMLRS